MVQIPGLSDSAALSALKNGLWHESRLREELTVNRPSNIQDALHRASNWIVAEEEKAALAKKYKVSPKPSFDQGARRSSQGQRPGPGTFAVDHQKGGPKGGSSKSQFGPRGRNGASPTNKWVREEQDDDSFCELHKVAGHATRNCKKLMHLLAERFVSGGMPDITIDELDQAQNTVQLVAEMAAEEEELPPAKKPKALIEEIPQGTKKRIDVIMGGSRMFRNSIRAIKDHQRKLSESGPKRQKTCEVYPEITFSENETEDLDSPHDDALVITLDVANHEVCRILVDTGSSVDLIFLDTLVRMGIDKSHITGPPAPLVSFTSETSMSLGTITLPVAVQGTSKMIEFTVFDRPAAYNAILGTPWLYQMKAVPSTYHQCVKFTTPNGVREILGSQRVARSCYLAGHKLLVQ
ncbi:uncharacterized protein LOC111829493 [Capsella rubella]|uniref:uncharacterized protein LOC111829493 n=1 Tax=Capsella rubella TaxID=81985 RepID=UPI000CD4A6AB|nr:uncharacterized protein LOC111829493 [Capsella rubella]